VQAERVQFLDRREAAGPSNAEEEYPSASFREAAPAPRRAAPAPSLDPAPRTPGNGAARGGFGAPGTGPASTPRRPLPEPEPAGEDDEDIPF
jgi:single-stranded DNA-binding protein